MKVRATSMSEILRSLCPYYVVRLEPLNGKVRRAGNEIEDTERRL